MNDSTIDPQTLDAPSAMRVPHVQRIAAPEGASGGVTARHVVRSAAPPSSSLAAARARAPQILRSSTMSAHTEPAQLSFEFSRM